MDWTLIISLVVIPISIGLLSEKILRLIPDPRNIGADTAKPKIRWIDEAELPRYARKRIGKHFESFLAAGFQHVGYLEVKHRCITTYDCYFEKGDRVVAEISVSKLPIVPAMTGLSMKSLLSDGTIIESTEKDKLPNCVSDIGDEPKFQINCTGTKEPKEIYDSHIAELNRLTNSSDNAPIPVDQALIPELVEYGLNLADHYLFKQGLLPGKPASFFGAESSA